MAGSGFEAVLVALGAIPGAWLRLKWVNHLQPMLSHKHWGTVAVNVLACFSLGLVLALVERCGAATGAALLLGVGFLGSLSTFSTFVVDVLNAWRAGRGLLAFTLVLASVLLGLGAAAAGYGLGGHG